MAYLMKTTFFKINSNASELIFTVVLISVKNNEISNNALWTYKKKIKQPKSKMSTVHYKLYLELNGFEKVNHFLQVENILFVKIRYMLVFYIAPRRQAKLVHVYICLSQSKNRICKRIKNITQLSYMPQRAVTWLNNFAVTQSRIWRFSHNLDASRNVKSKNVHFLCTYLTYLVIVAKPFVGFQFWPKLLVGCAMSHSFCIERSVFSPTVLQQNGQQIPSYFSQFFLLQRLNELPNLKYDGKTQPGIKLSTCW